MRSVVWSQGLLNHAYNCNGVSSAGSAAAVVCWLKPASQSNRRSLSHTIYFSWLCTYVAADERVSFFPMPVPSMAADLPGCVLYFFLFMSLGSITPFLPVIWRGKGLSGEGCCVGDEKPDVTLAKQPSSGDAAARLSRGGWSLDTENIMELYMLQVTYIHILTRCLLIEQHRRRTRKPHGSEVTGRTR